MGSVRGGGVVPCLVLVFVLISLSFADAVEFLVGGKENLWKIPKKPDGLIHWASKMRFLIGDSIEIKYDPKEDSVLQVTEQNYEKCNKTNPIKNYDDGDTKILFDHSGPYYFISGAQGHCEKGQKMLVRVLSAKHGHRSHHHEHIAPTTSPVKSPSTMTQGVVGFLAPAPVPSGGDIVKSGVVGVALLFVSIFMMVV